MVSQKPKYCKKNFERNSHRRKLSMIMVWERYCNASPKPEFFLFSVYIFIHISANMSLFGLKFPQMILNTETSKLMYNWSFFSVVLHKQHSYPLPFIMHYQLSGPGSPSGLLSLGVHIYLSNCSLTERKIFLFTQYLIKQQTAWKVLSNRNYTKIYIIRHIQALKPQDSFGKF